MAAADAGTTRWRLGRLAAMGPSEVGLRAARAARDRLRRRSRPAPQGAVAPGRRALGSLEGADVLARLGKERGSILPGGRDPAATGACLERIGAGRDSAAEAAAQALGGSISAFGWTSFDAGWPRQWHHDPVSGLEWPLAWFSEVDFRSDGRLGDPRYVWEVNRCHDLVTLGRAHALTGDPAFAEAIWQSIASWIGANPPWFGINWASPLEVALRLISWAMALDLTGGEGGTPALAADIATSVWLQARHVSDNLSRYASSRNNHLIGEAAGLLVAGTKFPWLAGAGAWRRIGAGLLARDVPEQIAPDGVPREQAFQYGVFVLEFCLAALAADARPAFRGALSGRMRAMAAFHSAVAGADGAPPLVGDGDGGRAYELSDRPGRQAQRAAACAAVAADLPVPRGFLAADLEPAVWLFGSGGALRWLDGREGRPPAKSPPAGVAAADAARSATDGSVAFTEGGSFVLRGDGQHCVVDCGPLGYRSIAAHGHADCLSVAICLGNEWIVPDPGTCCYHRDRRWRDHFRSTRAHSAVAVDGASQSEMLGPFMWGRRARATAERWATHAAFDLFQGSHDGYARVGVLHRRTVLLGRLGYWIIVDELLGTGAHEVELSLQLAAPERIEITRPAAPVGITPAPERTGIAPTKGERAADASAHAAGAGATEVRAQFAGGRAAVVRAWLPGGLHAELRTGVPDPPAGWVSSGFGEKHAAPALVAEGTVDLPVRAALAIVAGPEDWGPSVELRGLDRRGGAFAATLAGDVDAVLLGRVEDPAGGIDFAGALGLGCLREGKRSSFGLDVDAWREGGREVEYQDVADAIAAPIWGKEHARG